ncbi:hypothetical protein LY76DRAFT_114836 [Colletotrichum caudatum]|nr:hypothetical protein LY76DRAFT_114836 [Colletotrichum caudatum]
MQPPAYALTGLISKTPQSLSTHHDIMVQSTSVSHRYYSNGQDQVPANFDSPLCPGREKNSKQKNGGLWGTPNYREPNRLIGDPSVRA